MGRVTHCTAKKQQVETQFIFEEKARRQLREAPGSQLPEAASPALPTRSSQASEKQALSPCTLELQKLDKEESADSACRK